MFETSALVSAASPSHSPAATAPDSQRLPTKQPAAQSSEHFTRLVNLLIFILSRISLCHRMLFYSKSMAWFFPCLAVPLRSRCAFRLPAMTSAVRTPAQNALRPAWLSGKGGAYGFRPCSIVKVEEANDACKHRSKSSKALPSNTAIIHKKCSMCILSPWPLHLPHNGPLKSCAASK